MTTPTFMGVTRSTSTWTAKSSMTGLDSSVSAIWWTSASSASAVVALDLELEPLALADVEDAVEPEARQRAVHGLALGVEDLRLGHHFDDDAGHGRS